MYAYFRYYPSITGKEDALLNTPGVKVQVRIRLFDIVKTTFSSNTFWRIPEDGNYFRKYCGIYYSHRPSPPPTHLTLN
jgi:hypothetical protein